MNSLRAILFVGLYLGLISATALAKETPPEISRVVDRFLNQEQVSIDIVQEIHWKFYRKVDSLQVFMDIYDNAHFRLLLPGFGMEVYVLGDSLVTVNHTRGQILLETATRDELIDQLFIGGDISDAKLVRTSKSENGNTRDEFVFKSDISEWQRLTMEHDKGLPKRVELVDYDGNRYLIKLRYQRSYRSFDSQLPARNSWNYELADIRKQP
jgi:hypothetical protein